MTNKKILQEDLTTYIKQQQIINPNVSGAFGTKVDELNKVARDKNIPVSDKVLVDSGKKMLPTAVTAGIAAVKRKEPTLNNTTDWSKLGTYGETKNPTLRITKPKDLPVV